MRKTISLIIIAFSCLHLFAQNQETTKPSVLIGARAGIDLFDMRYSSDDISIYRHHYGVREQIGIFAEYAYLWKGLSIRCDLLYSPRGAHLSWKDIDYKLRSYYFDIRIPISYTFLRDKKVQPYVMVAPNVNFVLGGNARYYSDYLFMTYNEKLSKANFQPVDFSIFFGAGAKAPLSIGNQTFYVGGEFGYNLGVINTFSKMELNNTAHAVNLPQYEVNGTRKNGGFELAATFAWAIPQVKKTPKIEKTIVEEPAPTPTPVEPVIEEPKNDNLIEYTPKECYSIEEIQAFITLKMSIDDKRICMFDMKFEFASSVLKKESEKQLDKFVEMYRKSPTMKLLINGHTDNVGSDEYNQKLSEDRAKSVYDYFLKHGIPADKMSVKGFGSKYPIDTNETEEGRAKNRRVEVDIENLSE